MPATSVADLRLESLRKAVAFAAEHGLTVAQSTLQITSCCTPMDVVSLLLIGFRPERFPEGMITPGLLVKVIDGCRIFSGLRDEELMACAELWAGDD
jgi:hypothetical protein